jgi:aminoglycoside 6'-N-acetyltransferase
VRPSGELAFRPLVPGDLGLVHDWLGREHVRRWWGEPGRYEETVLEYLPAIEGRERKELFAIVLGGSRVGLIQAYLVSDHPDYAALVDVGDDVAGLDLLIGEADLVGRGLGARVIGRFVTDVLFARAATRACVADPDVRNVASIRAFERAGFTRVRDFHDPGDGQVHALVRIDRG